MEGAEIPVRSRNICRKQEIPGRSRNTYREQKHR